MAGKVVAHTVDPADAARRFRRAMTRGFFRPGDLESAGQWEPPKALLVPVRVVRVTLSSNWSALSGTNQKNGHLTWMPVTGQHRGVHADIVLPAAAGPWFRRLPRLVEAARSSATDGGARPDVTVVAPTVAEEATQQEALKVARKKEELACLSMVPGAGRKGIKVSSTVEAVEIKDVLVPLYEVAVVHHGTRHVGLVDGRTGALSVSPPTSAGRMAAVVGGVPGALLLAFVVLFALSTLSAAQLAATAAAKAEDDARLERARVEQVQVEWASTRDGLVASLGEAESKAAARDVAGARQVMSSVEPSLQRFDPDVDDETLDLLVKRSREVGAALDHMETVARGLAAARAVVGDKEQCTTLKAIGDAWADLTQTLPTDPEYKQAAGLTSKLERCRLSAEKELSAGLKKIMVGQRETMAAELERNFLDGGFDVDVRLRGAAKNELQLDYVLMSKVLVHQMTDGGSMSDGSLLSNLQKAGFRKVVFYDTWQESWSYTLEPQDEDHGGRTVLAGMGLGEPLVLTK